MPSDQKTQSFLEHPEADMAEPALSPAATPAPAVRRVVRRAPRKEVLYFSRQLAVFVRAGVPLLEALDAMADEISDKRLQAATFDVAERLRSGETLSVAAAHHPEVFPDVYVAVLRSAELTGNLDIVLDELADYMERDLEARRRVVAALTYPAVVLTMAVMTVAILTVFVLPRFERFFSSLHARLPLATRILLGSSHWMGTWWWAVVLAAVAAVVGVMALLRTQRGRDWRDHIVLRIPVIGLLLREAILERFCRILGALVAAGVPIPDSLGVAAEATDNAVYRKGLGEAKERMIRGEGLAVPLTDTGLFPAAARQMFRVGESTGTFEQELSAAAGYFDRELEYRIKRFTNLFEPAVIVVVGVVVGFVALALVSAMYGIFRQVDHI